LTCALKFKAHNNKFLKKLKRNSMSTGIQWTEETVNFWHGCHKVSEGCKFCYMYRDKETKYGGTPNVVLRTGPATFYKALTWKTPKMIFTCSWSDFFVEDADGWRDDAWDVIRRTPWHTWQILTKRPERILQCLPPDWGDGWDNVWLGVSIENQKRFDRAITLSKVPAKIRFISAEPLLEEVDLLQMHEGRLVMDAFQWCIIGGESGDLFGKWQFRECKVEWIERIIRDLKGTNVEVFVKQMGSHLVTEMNLRHPHGSDIENWPRHLRIRNFPKTDQSSDLGAAA
jgi:protein gp37